jgi:diguanylate cyclase
MKNPHSLPIALLICNDISKISFFKKTLKGTYYVMDARESFTALDWLKNTQIEIIILDHKTLDEPLINLCQHIRKIPNYQKTPILLITNKLQKAFTIESLNAGVTDFIHEPLEAMEVFERITVCLKSKMVSKKMSLVTAKIKAAPLIPKNTRTLLHRVLLNDQTLKKIAEEKKIATPLSMLMIQLDGMDKLADTLGELALEEIIEALNAFLQTRLRQFDTLLPQGSGKFLLLLPKTSQSAAKVMADDIRKEISRTTIPTHKKEVLVTVSVGVVAFDKQLSDAAQAYEQFDLSLSRVKKALEQAQKTGNKTVSS